MWAGKLGALLEYLQGKHKGVVGCGGRLAMERVCVGSIPGLLVGRGAVWGAAQVFHTFLQQCSQNSMVQLSRVP